MTESTAPEEGKEGYKPNGHKPGRMIPPAINSKPAKVDGGVQSVFRQEESTFSSTEDAPDEEDMKIIQEVLDDMDDPQPESRPMLNRAEKAASLVSRHASQASTDAIFKEFAARVTNDLRTGQQGVDGLAHGSMASAAYVENAGLIRAVFKAAAHAANETEAGLQAALSIPLMIQQYRRVYRGLWTAIPALSMGVDVLSRFLYRTPETRSLLMELPKVLGVVIDRLARHVSHRGAISSDLVSMVLAEETEIWLSTRGRPGPSNSNLAGNQEDW